jgi:acyl-coenzyme A synthetase/AMP-(fatty) acid ligase
MTMEATRDLPKAGFQFILEDIEKRIRHGMRVRDALDEILSLGGRQPLTLGMESLTTLQAGLYGVAANLMLHIGTPSEQRVDEGEQELWHLGIWSHGRIWLSLECPSDPECRLLGTVALPLTFASAVEIAAGRMQDAWEERDAEMDAFLAQCDEEALRRVLFEVHESIDHMDPVLLYIGDATFTNFGKFNNLQERNGADLPGCFYRRVHKMTPAEWTREEKIFVFCFYWLRVAGCRGEEFCGRQLNPALLDAYLEQRLAEYRELAPRLFTAPAGSIESKARLLARVKTECAQDVMTYRWINGLNFYKEERLCSRPLSSRDMATLPEPVRAHLADAYGVDSASCKSLQQLFDNCIARMAESGFASDDSELHAFEKLMKVIVDSAITATGSDVGLTRGFRDIQRWQKAFADKSYDAICNWASGDYYCGVFPSNPFHSRMRGKPDLLVKILYACSGRMQFNSWHYMPGHCPRESVSADRHFYLPPRMPDMAVWSDQHHAGHSMAEVRFTIRAPAAIEIAGRSYPGMIDLRLFRQRGVAYSEEEFFCALRHTECLRAAYQALADHVARTGKAVTIDAFDKDWFKRYYGRLDEVQAATSPADVPALAPIISRAMAPVTAHAAATGDKPAMGELFRILCQHAAHDDVALIEARHLHADCTLTYRALVAHALALRDVLHGRNIGPGSCIALRSERPLQQAVMIIAGLANGVIVNTINPGLSAAMLDGQLRHARPELLIIGEGGELPDSVAADLPCAHWDELFTAVKDFDPNVAAQAMDSMIPSTEDLAGLLVYTSGTTGEPKGVLLHWRQIAANVRHAIDALGYEAGWIAGSLLPRFHTFTIISDLLPSLFLGGRTVLVNTFDLPGAKSIVEAFRRHGVYSYSAPATILEVWCTLRAWVDTPSLRFAVAGAAPLKERTRLAYSASFGHPIIPCYGLSETTCFATISQAESIRPGAVGKPAGIEICVFDELGTLAPRGATGELAMRGPSVIRDGYFRDHERRFAKSFTSDGWFLTGDIGRIDEDGYVFVTGRKKNMVIRGGEKVYLEDLDRCLFDYPGVVDCASIAQCEPGAADVALTFIVTADNQPISREDISALVRSVLTHRHIPDRVYFIDRIPRTPSGKASHPELLARAFSLNAAAVVHQ